MAEYDTRPLSVYRTGEWRANANGHAVEAGPSTARAGRGSTSTFVGSSRRRTSAALPPSTAPPINQPLPSIPTVSEATTMATHRDQYILPQSPEDTYGFSLPSNSTTVTSNPFQRPTASSQLAAVTQFSQARIAAVSTSPPSTFSGSLSDSPPRSLLPRNPQPQIPQVSSQEIIPDRLLLSPPELRSPTSQGRPSSRRALTKALELAREAVKLDSTNDDPRGAIEAYGRSVALLNEVMERVMRGEDTGEHRRKNGRRRSIVAQEEEVRRLKSIHDTYADRMNILSLIYNIPTNSSSQSSRPDSPASESSKDDTSTLVASELDSEHVDATPVAASREGAYQNTRDNNQPSEGSMSSNRVSTVSPTVSRLRAPSNLPPRPPCPSGSPPSTPTIIEPPPAIMHNSPSSSRLALANEVVRSRGSSISHRRTGSANRLEALREETVLSTAPLQQQYHYDHEHDLGRTQLNGAYLTPRTTRNSPPLPALPDSESSSITPRAISAETADDANTSLNAGRPRGGSAPNVQIDISRGKGGSTLINESPVLGTISQRRNRTNVSLNTQDNIIEGETGLPRRLTGASLPTPTTSSIAFGRSRALSQPARPMNQGTAEFGLRPGYSNVQQPPTGLRQGPSLFRQSPQPPHLTPSSLIPLHTPVLTLIPPPPVLPGQLPTTPTSPLPPLPPSDPLRKPYHLMSLLRHTMVSTSGGYITRRLHVPYDVWSQGGAKLANLPEKIRVVEVLCDALAEVQNASVEFCGPMGVANGMGLGIGSVTRQDGQLWTNKLEEFLLVCDNVVSSFGKKLGVGEGFVVKKSSGVGSWGGKLTRQLDKLTNGKNLDSPMSYVQGLQKLFQLAQLLDEHTKALNSQPIAPSYMALGTDLRLSIEVRLKRSSEFFASVVLTFVIRDLSQLLDKYAKKGEKWLTE